MAPTDDKNHYSSQQHLDKQQSTLTHETSLHDSRESRERSRQHSIVQRGTAVLTSTLTLAMLLAGCGQQTASKVPNLNTAPRNTAQPGSVTASDVERVLSRSYDANTHTVTLSVRRDGVLSGRGVRSATGVGSVEDLLNVSDPAAITNYATAAYPTKTITHVRLNYQTGPVSGIHNPGRYTANQDGTNVGKPDTTGANPTVSNATGTNTTGGGLTQAPTGAMAAGASQYVMTNKGWVSYHSRPWLKSSILGRLQVGDRAPLVRKVNVYWYEINWAGRNVYITTNSTYTHLVGGAGAGTTGAGTPGTTTPGTTTPGTGTTGTTATAPATTATKTVTVPSSLTQPTPTVPSASAQGATSSIKLPPPGVRWDPNITPMAARTATVAAKTSAVLNEAKSKLGTPYIWGHNEDRGQYGFDCSNFTEYVYHHALGYLMTTSSRGQYKYVGVNVPASQMRPGDLLIFNDGGHVGIYAGNNQMIEEGGGLGKVGYLSVSSASYWGKHLSAVRRMY